MVYLTFKVILIIIGFGYFMVMAGIAMWHDEEVSNKLLLINYPFFAAVITTVYFLP